MKKAIKPDQMTDWTTSASISDTLRSFFQSNKKDPIYNFRTFAFPALIQAIWVFFSWIWLLMCIGVPVFYLLSAFQQEQQEYQIQSNRIDDSKKEFLNGVQQKSRNVMQRLGGMDFLSGAPLIDTKQLEVKEAIQSGEELRDVLVKDKNKNLRCLAGTTSLDIGEKLDENVWRVNVGNENNTLIKFYANNDHDKWIGMIWKKSWVVPESHLSSLRPMPKALLISGLSILCLLPGLLLIRLLCETAILFFRFVDEIAAIHCTIREQRQKEIE